MRNVLDKSCRENKNTFYIQHLLSENFTVYEIIPKIVEETEGPQMTSQYGAYAFACWISKAICICSYAHAHTPGYPHARARAHERTDQ